VNNKSRPLPYELTKCFVHLKVRATRSLKSGGVYVLNNLLIIKSFFFFFFLYLSHSGWPHISSSYVQSK